MSILKTIIDSLPDESRRLLVYAFENDLSQYIKYRGNRFIGINTSRLKNLIIEEEIGNWSIGTVKEK